MYDNQQLQQLLQQLRQKNSQDPSIAPPQVPVAQPFSNGRPEQIQQQPEGSRTLGFLGGLGDTQNAVTGVYDPSILTQLNQYMIKNQTGQQPLPWQQTAPQEQGHDAGSALAKFAKWFM